jgi:hypothetical protein
MDHVQTIQELLASGADVAIVVFAYVLWRMDRRLLLVEVNLKAIWHKFKELDGEK